MRAQMGTWLIWEVSFSKPAGVPLKAHWEELYRESLNLFQHE